MNLMNRRAFLLSSLGCFIAVAKTSKTVITVNGPIEVNQLGTTLIHEHFLVDFIGADKTTDQRWNRDAVLKKVLPYLLEAKKAGVKSVFDCTPAFLGRDVKLLQMLSAQSGLHIITNTGYYGAVDNKYLPPHAFTETAEQLAARWIKEAKNGIDGAGIRPGFIKISVDAKEPLSELHQKLVRAAALTHLKTGLVICSHTGPAAAAFQEIDILKKAGVHPSAFVWVHAQAEKDKTTFTRAANMGAWISLDGIGWGEFDNYADSIIQLKKAGLLHKVLLSHDAGWYKPDEPDASFQGFTNIFNELFPRLKKSGFTQNDFDQLLIKNPAEAMCIQVRSQ